MRAVLDIVLIVLDLYVWLLIASAVLSWLIAFNVVNTRNPFVTSVTEVHNKITEPVLRPIRNMLPNFGGLDISPIIVILIIMFLQRVITYYIFPNVICSGGSRRGTLGGPLALCGARQQRSGSGHATRRPRCGGWH